MVTIVIPIYNGAAFIADTVQSVLNQSYNNWDLILSDDGSTDEGLQIAEQTAKGRLRVLSYPTNTGVGAALNRGIRVSDPTKPFIFTLGADDLLAKDALLVLTDAIAGHGVARGRAINIGSHTSLDEFHTLVESTTMPPPKPKWGPVMMQRSLFQHYGLLDESLRHATDGEYWMRLFGPDYTRKDRATYTVVERVLLGRRLHPGQLLQTFKSYTPEQRQAEKEQMESLVRARLIDPFSKGITRLD